MRIITCCDHDYDLVHRGCVKNWIKLYLNFLYIDLKSLLFHVSWDNNKPKTWKKIQTKKKIKNHKHHCCSQTLSMIQNVFSSNSFLVRPFKCSTITTNVWKKQIRVKIKTYNITHKWLQKCPGKPIIQAHQT